MKSFYAAMARNGQGASNVDFNYIVTLCDQAQESCPYFLGRTVHHNFTKPSTKGTEEEILQSFVQVRDEIRAWIKEQFGN